jgi:hypothetical protein
MRNRINSNLGIRTKKLNRRGEANQVPAAVAVIVVLQRGKIHKRIHCSLKEKEPTSKFNS